MKVSYGQDSRDVRVKFTGSRNCRNRDDPGPERVRITCEKRVDSQPLIFRRIGKRKRQDKQLISQTRSESPCQIRTSRVVCQIMSPFERTPEWRAVATPDVAIVAPPACDLGLCRIRHGGASRQFVCSSPCDRLRPRRRAASDNIL